MAQGNAGGGVGLPDRLPTSLHTITARGRLVWLALLVLVAAIQAVGFGFVLYDSYRINPALAARGLALEFDDRDRPIVKPLRRDILAAGVTIGDRIVAVGQQRFGPDASMVLLARAIMAAPADRLVIRVRKADGREIVVDARRSSRAAPIAGPPPIPVGLRLAIRLAFTLLSSLSLLGSSLILLRRRPHDPEAFLLGVGFLGIAASVDPPLLMWMSIGWDRVIDGATGFWWTILVIALAAFPDGRFTPSWLRWSLVAAPILGLILMLNRLADAAALGLGVGVPLLLLLAQGLRYRRLEPGVKRQQIKCAALGFSAGFLIVGIALAMAMAGYDGWRPAQRSVWMLATVCLFNLGFALLPLGLLVSLVRYRLWDVDEVISRSIAYTVLSGGIGLLWALLSDVAKQIVAALAGPDHALLGLVLGAIIAVGVFVPSQSVVLHWSKRRFNPASVALDRLPERLRAWRERCDAAELAARTLDLVLRGLHAEAGALFSRTPTGRVLLASRSADGGDAAAAASTFASVEARGGYLLALEDEDGLAGWLVLAPRSDGARFPKSGLRTLAAAAAPLAQALRMAKPVHHREAAVLSLLDEVQQRLARLEQQASRPG